VLGIGEAKMLIPELPKLQYWPNIRLGGGTERVKMFDVPLRRARGTKKGRRWRD